MPQVFVDIGAWYALLDKTDSCHAHAVEFFQSLAHPLVTTNYIADETITLAKNRLEYEVAVKIGQMLWDEDVATLLTLRARSSAPATAKHCDRRRAGDLRCRWRPWLLEIAAGGGHGC